MEHKNIIPVVVGVGRSKELVDWLIKHYSFNVQPQLQVEVKFNSKIEGNNFEKLVGENKRNKENKNNQGVELETPLSSFYTPALNNLISKVNDCISLVVHSAVYIAHSLQTLAVTFNFNICNQFHFTAPQMSHIVLCGVNKNICRPLICVLKGGCGEDRCSASHSAHLNFSWGGGPRFYFNRGDPNPAANIRITINGGSSE